MPPPAPVHPDWLVRSRLAQSPFGDCVLCAEREGVLEPAVLETFLADESVRSALLEPTRAPPGDALREGLARAFVDAELERHGVHVERAAVHELVARWSWDLLTELDQARSDVERIHGRGTCESSRTHRPAAKDVRCDDVENSRREEHDTCASVRFGVARNATRI